MSPQCFRSPPRAAARAIDSNIVHHRLIRRGKTNRLPSVILSAAKDLGAWREILRCAQDDKPVLTIPATFWPILVGLLNEYVVVNAARVRPYYRRWIFA